MYNGRGRNFNDGYYIHWAGRSIWKWVMTQRFSLDRKPFIIWVLANMLGFGALGVALLLFPGLMSVSGVFASTLIVSVPIAIAQWIALRRLLPVSKLWTLTIPVCLPLILFIQIEFPELLSWMGDDESSIAIGSVYFVIGLIIALPQWLLLRPLLPNSSIWLLGSATGLGLGLWIVLATELINHYPTIAYIVVALVYAVSTGLILSWLHGRRDRYQSNEVPAT